MAQVLRNQQLERVYRGVEQLVARWAHNPKVVGSSPAPATKRKASEEIQELFLFRAVGSSLGSYPPAGGRRFESCPR
jgi:hypothetical protein